MKRSLILKTSAPAILVIAVGASLYILIRGHNAPGGGFLGGLIASGGIVFFLMARGIGAARQILPAAPVAVCATGLLVAVASGLVTFLEPSSAYLTHRWWPLDLGIVIPLGTTLIFDLGVYLTVIGTMSTVFIYIEGD